MAWGNKGNLASFIYLGIGLLVFAVIIGLTSYVNMEYWDTVQEAGLVDEQNVTGTAVAGAQATFSMFDVSFIFIYVAFCLFSFVGAFFVDSHPIFFVFNFLGSIILAFVGAIFTNIFMAFASQSALVSTFDSYTTMLYVMIRLPMLLLVGSVIVAVLTLAKNYFIPGKR